MRKKMIKEEKHWSDMNEKEWEEERKRIRRIQDKHYEFGERE